MAVRRGRARSRGALFGLLSLALVLALLGGFAAGYWYAQGVAAAAPPPPADEALPAAYSYSLLDEIRGIVDRDYLRQESVDPQRLVWGAARGLVQALDDPNSVYENPFEREANESRWTGRYQGVGLFADQKDGLMVVTAPVEGGPAARAGIRPGDVVLEVDGRSLLGLTLTQQTMLIRGPRGSSVVLTVRREGVPGAMSVPMVREEIRLISARGRMLDSGLAVLRISQFTEGTLEETRVALDSLLADRPKGLLLDLRSNAGGLLEPAVKVAGLFLGPGPVVLEAHADGQVKTYQALDEPAMTELPMLVLVDRGTASASEILAAALRDRTRAELLGERTYGKSTVQYIHRLSDGSGLRLTVAVWHAPSGQPIPISGLVPDHLLPMPASVSTDRDPVLEQAAQLLSTRLGAPAR